MYIVYIMTKSDGKYCYFVALICELTPIMEVLCPKEIIMDSIINMYF